MDADFGILHHLWNDRDGQLLERAAGEVGLDRIVIPVVTGRIDQLRFADDSSRHFHTEGGWHFHPQAGAYENTRIKPRSARWLSTRDALGRLCEGAAQMSVRVIFRVDLRGVPSIIEHNPLVRTRNAWGDEVPAAGMCVSNPDVRELLRATLDDLTRFDPAGFEIVAFANDHPLSSDFAGLARWSPAAWKMRSLCFCPSCRQIAINAGCDPEMSARSARVDFDAAAGLSAAKNAPEFTNPAPAHAPAQSNLDPVLRAYVKFRVDDTARWLAQLGQRHDSRIRMHLMDTSVPPPTLNWEGWKLLARVGMNHSVDPETFCWRPADEAGMSLPIWRPSIPDSSTLVRIVADYTAAGVRYLDFEGADESPPEALQWLRQALRYARRQ